VNACVEQICEHISTVIVVELKKLYAHAPLLLKQVAEYVAPKEEHWAGVMPISLNKSLFPQALVPIKHPT
jgi:hypothetical protein